MNNLILILCAVLAYAKGQVHNVMPLGDNSNYVSGTENYINLNRLQYANAIEDYDRKIAYFKRDYLARIEGINVGLDMVTANIVQTEERLNPLELVNDFNKNCITKYRKSIPTVANTKTSITQCITDATNQVPNLINSPLTTRNALQTYYTNNFEREIVNCGKTYNNRTTNYTSCVTTAVSTANTNTIINQKSFVIQMDASECSGNAFIKKALDCSNSIQTNTISRVAETNVLVNNCLAGKDECPPSVEGYTCRDKVDLDYESYRNKTILNPFYGIQDHVGCFTLIVLPH